MSKKEKYTDEYLEIWEGIKDRSSRLDEFRELHFRDYFDFLERVADTSVVQSDLIDSIRFSRVFKNSQGLKRDISRATNNRKYSIDAAAYQLWTSMYNGEDPMVREELQVDSEMGEYFQKSIAEMADTIEYKRLAEKTCGSPTYATMATMSMLESFCDYIDKSMEKDGKDPTGNDDGEGQPQPGEGQPQPGEPPPPSITEAMMEAMSKIKDGLQETKDNIDNKDAMGKQAGTSPPSDADEDPSKYIEAFERLDERYMRQILDALGSVEEVSQQGTASMVRSRGGRRTYSIGGQLSALPEYEMAKFVDDDLADLLMVDLVSSEAFQLNDMSPASRGPIVVCVDISGSMEGEDDIVARAISLATVKMSMSTNRHVDVVLFNSVSTLYNMKNSEDVFKMLTSKPSGGTDFDGSMDMALKRCIELRRKNAMSKADILFLTDGSCNFSSKTEHIKNKTIADASIYVLKVSSGNGNYGYYNSGDIKAIFSGLADYTSEVASIEDFGKSESVREFWKSVMRAV